MLPFGPMLASGVKWYPDCEYTYYLLHEASTRQSLIVTCARTVRVDDMSRDYPYSEIEPPSLVSWPIGMHRVLYAYADTFDSCLLAYHTHVCILT